MKPSPFEIIKSIPVLRVLVFLIAGIVLREYIYVPQKNSLLFILIQFVFLLTINFFRWFSAFHLSWVRGLAIAVFYIAAGYARTEPSLVYVESPVREDWYGEVKDFPLEKKNSFLVPVELWEMNSHTLEIGAGAHVYIPKSPQTKGLKPGDKVFFHAGLKPPESPGNPEEFDYPRWLRSGGIYFQAFVRKGEWTFWREEKIPLKYFPRIIRNRIQERIFNSRGGIREKEVLAAVSLGAREQLDRELRQKYANAGAIHVMAVSGLHVGMIWMFLSFFLNFFRFNRFNAILKFLILIFFLWFYALMTGMSPSVSRSCLMFTLVSAGELLERKTRTINTLLLAAFLQLLINPDLIYDTGFQFSYLAVLGILLFHDRINKLLRLDFPLSGFFTGLISVSLSAQVFTLPLAIVYFHQFPVWFLLSNIIIIPLVTLIMMIFLLSCILFPLPVFNHFLLFLDLKLTFLMNVAVERIGRLPFAVAEGLSLGNLQLALMLIFPLIFLLFLEYRRFHVLIFLQLMAICFLFSGIKRSALGARKKEFLVYNLKGKSAAGLRNNGVHYVFTILPDSDLQLAAGNYWIKNYYPEPEFIDFNKMSSEYREGIFITSFPGKGNFILQSEEFRAVFLNSPGMLKSLRTRQMLRADVLVLSGSAMADWQVTGKFFEIETLVISSSVPLWQNSGIPGAREGIKISDVRKEGAFMYSLNVEGIKKKQSGLRQLRR